MSTLYEIKQQFSTLIGQVEIADGEITPELEQALQINQQELQDKSLAYVEVIKQREAMNLRIDEEVKRLQAIKKRNLKLIDKLQANLIGAVHEFGEFNSGLLTFGIRKSQSVLITVNDSDLPKAYLTTKVEMKADKTKIKQAIERGEVIDGAHLVTNYNLKLK